MGDQQAVESGSNLFGTSGYPREAPQGTRPWSAAMAKSMAGTIAEIEAQRLEQEAEMNTPGGRLKAAKAIEADLAEKRRAWGTRVGATPLDGFVGIYDSAKDKEIKVYTRTYDLQHRYWGIKPVGMTIWDFWDINDPEVTRYHDANQETPATPEPMTLPPSSTKSLQPAKATAKPKRRQKSSNINPTHRVKKPTPPSKVDSKKRKSLVSKIDSRASEIYHQVQEVEEPARVRGRPSRNKTAMTASGPRQESAETKPAVQEKISSPLKRPRGRPPAKGTSTGRPSKQEKNPAVKGNARITKPSQKASSAAVPSTHKMRTRRAGPAEPLQLP